MEKILKSVMIFALFAFIFNIFLYSVNAQVRLTPSVTLEATTSAIATQSAEEAAALKQIVKEDITTPEALEDKDEIIDLFQARPADDLSITNFMAYLVQGSVKSGVPANTIVLILLLPFLATFFAVIRIVIGLSTLEMLVPIILSIAFIATGVTIGSILLATIIIASFLSRLLLKKIKIMQLPKMAISLLIVSFCVFIAITVSAFYGIVSVKQISIFPILVFILISDKIVELQLQRNFRQTVIITLVTIGIAVIGYLFLSAPRVQSAILIYPEIVLILIPANLLLGRYFGLRFTEYLRFSSLIKNGNK